MTLGDIVAHSSNIGSAMVAERVGSAELASVLARFGYGTPTGVGFPGEAGGVVPELIDWTDITRATVSYGQGISMTPLQMAAVYATVANGGMSVQPRLVRGTSGPDGRLEAAPRRRLAPGAVGGHGTMLTRMLASVVETGTGRRGPDPRLSGGGEDRARHASSWTAGTSGGTWRRSWGSCPRRIPASSSSSPSTNPAPSTGEWRRRPCSPRSRDT